MMILSIIATVVLLGVLFYHRVSLFLSSLILLAWTAALAVAGLWNIWLLVPLALILLPLNLVPMRKSMISAPVFKGFRKVMPPMSRTEKEAIDAGTTWWEGDLFQGNPDWKKLHNYPQPRLTAEEQAFIDGPVEEACRMANDFAITHEMADLPPELWAYLKEHRFFAMIIKKEYGGLEFSAYAQARVLQKLAGVSGILAITVGVPNSLGPGELLQHYGTEEQKDHYLPRLARGQEIPCFALTSPEAGSDAGAIPDMGVVCMGEWQGEQVLGMRLTWNKRYITLAPIATVLGLAFKLSDPEKLLGGEEDLGITCALIPTSTPGVEIGRRHFPLNVPFQNGPTRGQDIFVPIDYIIGGPKMAGQGWRMLVECLSVVAYYPAVKLNRWPEIRGDGDWCLRAYPPSVQNFHRQDGRYRRAAGTYRRQCLRDGRRRIVDYLRHYARRKTGRAVGDCEVPLYPSRAAVNHRRDGYCGR
ncbi:acyl-CoA dehydrogenase [Enterobacter cancerogenus]|uniref:Acyl-CoA dehydrogenase n=1 Tax=Enterobacter cancerogenus TaxID=69218 RepID=A0A484WV14_9ENTR|nr:acyl-CoA dehydrogenase [Enterobacter cancerogenus]